MELSARDKRILADIECASALEDPRWTRRLERLARHGARLRHRPRPTWRHRFLYASAVLTWLTLLAIAATVAPPLLWSALSLAIVSSGAWTIRRRRIYGYWLPRRQRRIMRIPRQGGRR